MPKSKATKPKRSQSTARPADRNRCERKWFGGEVTERDMTRGGSR